MGYTEGKVLKEMTGNGVIWGFRCLVQLSSESLPPAADASRHRDPQRDIQKIDTTSLSRGRKDGTSQNQRDIIHKEHMASNSLKRFHRSSQNLRWLSRKEPSWFCSRVASYVLCLLSLVFLRVS